MKLRSFRLRIAAVSALLAGSTLIGFGIASWLLIYKTKVDRLDTEIKSRLLQEAAKPPRIRNRESREYPQNITFSTNSAVLILDRQGKSLYQSENWPNKLNIKQLRLPEIQPINSPPFPPPRPLEYPLPPDFPPPPPPESGFNRPPLKISPIQTKSTDRGAWRVGMVTAPYHRVAIAVSFNEIDREMNSIRNIFLIAVPLLLIFVALAAWWLSGSALLPIRQVTATICGVTAKGLDRRISVAEVDVEFVEMLQVFNQMMERLERSFYQASRFSADAAHELKTPLAILQGELELALQKADSGSEMQQTLSNLIAEVHHLSAIVRKLLLLSLADTGQMRLHLVEVNLSPILADLAEDIEMLAPHLQVETKILPDLRTKGDRDLLIQVLQNLISNAIKYNLPSGWIKLEAGYKANNLFVTVTNSSQDISQKEREQIFNRFHRGNLTHNRKIEGVGLGLSLAREIALAHRGNLKLDPTLSGQTAFTLILPTISFSLPFAE
ncbi:sensor histidine kinase [Aerosakkonemataceae cyanobacterium BLCC-F154]|uniref:histidine kinase n=1 Tax=Floridaenema fluviatile BLCC-F154 TaxID=3153640 RepID=A0ABV4Y8D9_9CYAN